MISYRFINGNGFHNASTVYDLMLKFGNTWPADWIQRYPQLQQISIPNPTALEDELLWLGPNNVRQFFTVKKAWKTLEEMGPIAHWHKVVWNKAFIPKHAICMWMACHKRLPTQDRLIQWKAEPPDVKCVFCKLMVETHNHLFFQCDYSRCIWDVVKGEVGLNASPDKWEDIIDLWAMGHWRNWSTVQKLAIASTVYHIWLERNRKYFDNQNQCISKVVEEIKRDILLRMAWKTKNKLNQSNGS